MKRTAALIAAIMLVLSCFSGCGGKERSASESSLPEVMKKLKAPDITIEIPGSYETTSTDSNKTVYVKDDASIIVNSDKLPENCDGLDSYVDYALKTYTEYSDNIEILKNEPVDANGNIGNVLEYVYTINSENGAFSKYCMVGFFIGDEQIYLITCKADPDNADKYRDEFTSVVQSFDLKEDAEK